MADYKSNYSGAAIDKAIETALKLHFGTETVEATTKVKAVPLSITGFTPACVLVTARVEGVALPATRVSACTRIYNGVWYADLIYAGGEDSTTLSGTYYIDWIAIEE